MNSQRPERLAAVRITGPAPPCGRCGGPGLLSVRVPHAILRADGQTVHGTNVVVLCSRCDNDRPESGALITWFTVNGRIVDGDLDQLAALIRAWIAVARVPAVDMDALQAEIDAWRGGAL
ncbi:DUF6300 family protein [Nonomuraea sp. NPDC004702]